ncbi:hypothetical protein CR513_03390, partial [Mucuna pruriens]
MVITYRDWHEILPFSLHGYHTLVLTSIGETPYSLVYGMEVVLPIEVEIPSLRALVKAKLEEVEWVQLCYNQLNLIEEKRLATLGHGQLYQQRVKRAFDKKVHPCKFQGDLVLKKILPTQKDHRGKWTPNYEGPYVVKKAFSRGAMILTNMGGKDLMHPINSDALLGTDFILVHKRVPRHRKESYIEISDFFFRIRLRQDIELNLVLVQDPTLVK